MIEQSLEECVHAVLAEHYGQPVCFLHSLNTRFSDDDKRIVYQMYRAELPDGTCWVVFAVHEEMKVTHTYQWATQHDSPQRWLEERVGVLKVLATVSYSAPVVISARSEADVVQVGPWSFLVTTFIKGRQSQFFPEPLAEAGMLLARLHTLPLASMPISLSWWNTTYSLPHAIQSLENTRPSLPASQHAFFDTCLTTLYWLLHALPSLPTALIHGDSWMQNAVSTPEGMIVFIDWESAGRGAAILDLADALFRSQCEPSGALPNALKEDHITAVVSGYAQCRMPSEEELAGLVDVVRFSIVWRAAWRFTQIPFAGWSPSLERGLARLETAFALAQPTATIARSAFLRSKSFAS